MILVWGDRFYGRSTEEGLPNQRRRSGDMTLSSAEELSPEGSGHRGYRSIGGTFKPEQKVDVTLSSAGELSSEGSGYKGGEIPGIKRGSEAQEGHIDDFMFITDKLHQ